MQRENMANQRTGRREQSQSLKLAGVLMCGGLFALATSAVQAGPIYVDVTQDTSVESGFTLDFGFPGGVSNAQVSDTEFELEVDPIAGTARFEHYMQHVDPLTLPSPEGPVSTGDITITILASFGGTYDPQTGEFATNDIYRIEFDGDLSALGIQSPFDLPSSSSATVEFTGVAAGTTALNWKGGGELPNSADPQNPFRFNYQCDVNGVFVSTNSAPFIVASNPPSGSFDARQPHAPGNPGASQTWQTIEVMFNALPNTPISPDDFLVSEWGGDGFPPSIASITPLDDQTVSIELTQPVSPGAWTALLHDVGNVDVGICLGALPGDVNRDGVTSPTDILAAVDCLNGASDDACDGLTMDIDRSGVTDFNDVSRLLDLLDGTGFGQGYNGAQIPGSPCFGS